MEAKRHYSEDGTYYPPEMDPKPIHIDPRQFVDESKLPELRTRWQIRSFAADEEGYDDAESVPEDVVDEYEETEREVWADQFRRALADAVDVFGQAPKHRPLTVKVEYNDKDDIVTDGGTKRVHLAREVNELTDDQGRFLATVDVTRVDYEGDVAILRRPDAPDFRLASESIERVE
jgi:hypothetical protein